MRLALNWVATNGDTLELEVPFNLTRDELDTWAQRIGLLVDMEMRDPSLQSYTDAAIAWARDHYPIIQEN